MPTSPHRRRRALAAGALALGLASVPAVAAAADPVTLVPWDGSTWRVHDQGQDLIAAFPAPAFDDSAWKTYTVQPGKVLGYGDVADDQTPVLEFGGNASLKHTVTYFRTTFDVADPSAISDLTLEHLRDDGTIIHLNGVEVLRSNMPAGPVTSHTFSTDTVDGAAERAVHTNVIPTTALVAGENVLAVQLHQRSDSSSDIAFKLALRGQEEAIGVPATASAPFLLAFGAAGAAALVVVRRRPGRAR